MSQTTPPVTEPLSSLNRRLHDLLDERAGNPAVEAVRDAADKAWRGGRWTAPVLSALINRLLAIPADLAPVQDSLLEAAQASGHLVIIPVGAPVEAPAVMEGVVLGPQGYEYVRTPMTNKFSAACGACGTLVQVGEGTRAKVEGEWVITHLDGLCVPEGRYAVVIDGEVKFFRLQGKVVYAMASDELHALVGDPYIAQVLSLIRADFHAAFALYGQEIGRCGICGRKLTSKWRLVGIGPRCNERFGWV